MKYRKKPLEIEAELVADLIENFKHDFSKLPEWVKEAYENRTIVLITDNYLIVSTLERKIASKKEDYLIKGIKGEIYSCKGNIFKESYDKVIE